MTNRMELGPIDLVATDAQTGTGEYEWVEADEQPSYTFRFEPGCSEGCGSPGGTLTADSRDYLVKPMRFSCFSANSKTAAVNLANLLTVLRSAAAYTLRNTCSPDYTGAPVLLVRQSADAANPEVWTVFRCEWRRVRPDLDKNRLTLEVDLFCTEGGPVQVNGVTQFGGNGNPLMGGTFQGV